MGGFKELVREVSRLPEGSLLRQRAEAFLQQQIVQEQRRKELARWELQERNVIRRGRG